MTKEQFKKLKRGDIVRGKASGMVYIIDKHSIDCGGDDVYTAVRTEIMTNGNKWELINNNIGGQQLEPLNVAGGHWLDKDSDIMEKIRTLKSWQKRKQYYCDCSHPLKYKDGYTCSVCGVKWIFIVPTKIGRMTIRGDISPDE